VKYILIIIFYLTPIFAQDGFIGDVFDRGKIDYGNRTIQAIGIGFIPSNVINAGQARRSAMRIAKQDALRQLIEIVNGVNVTSETTISGAMFDDVIKSQVQGAIRGARRVGETRYLSDTSVEVTYEVSMNDISRVLLPMADKAPSLIYGETTAANPVVDATTNSVNITSAPISSGITGIIIDGTGLGLRPAMSPRVLDQSGNVIYGPGNYSREYATLNGVVGYTKTVDQAKSDARVQGNPLVLRGASASGSSQTDLIISNEDAAKMMRAEGTSGLLKDCRVIFIVG
jgi:hypothetical protein